MKITRRDFLKLSGGSAAGLMLLDLSSFTPGWPSPQAIPLKKRVGEKATVCPFCGVGCGIIAASEEGKITNIEGDPDNPINQGALCSKGSALFQVANNERRLKKVLYRAPGASGWEEKGWDWALEQIARRVKDTRDKTWMAKDKDGYLVNRTEAIASIGGCAQNNEEGYLICKAMRSLGIVFLEHEARLCHSSTVTALSESFGRGAMTNHWNDLANADVIMIIGSNAAEQHPISFKWVTRAIERGAKLISVDPRFTRTSSKAHIYAQMRSGTDTAFIGGMIKYVLDDMEVHPERYNMEYVREYTNASLLVNAGFGFDDGLFTGYNATKRSYDKATWQYQLDEKEIPRKDMTLKDPQCVFQLLKRHFARYDVDTVCNTTGTPKEIYLQVCQTYASSGARDRVGTIMYSMGATQHTNAVQMIRAYSILQLLLGNIGLAGGGINAMRGESNVQGLTDYFLFHLLPGYLKPPQNVHDSLDKYLKANTPVSKDLKSGNWWQHYPKYFISLQKAWWGKAASRENDFAYHYLPKISANYSWIALFEAMDASTIKGLLVLGMNPAVSSPDVEVCRHALGKLDWMVVADLWETETATFWKRPGVNPADINTEVFLLPAAASVEKEGSLTNSSRLAQWRYKAVDPPGEARSDLWIVDRLMTTLKGLYTRGGGPNAEAISGLVWDYGTPPDAHKVAREINGYDLTTGKLMVSFLAPLKDDGSTSSGNWLYCGSYTEAGNMMARRDPTDPSGVGLHSKWAWCWPVNRRILYNRASVDLQGQPWDPRHPVMKWDAAAKQWSGDVVDGFGAKGPAELYPFIMITEGAGRLFGGFTLTDGPLPEHYEPWESPIKNPFSGIQTDPCIVIWRPQEQGTPDKYPIVCTTFRVSEHWQAGAMTRNLPWLVELQPEMFVEIGEELALEKGIKNEEKVIVETARGRIEGVALVTRRFQPYKLNGRMIHQIGMPWHWGFAGLSIGDSANLLTPHVGDANTMIPEYKAFLCNIRRA